MWIVHFFVGKRWSGHELTRLLKYSIERKDDIARILDYQQNAPPLKNTIAYDFFLLIAKIQQIFFKILNIIDLSIFKKFCWILVVNKKVISDCIFKRWCVFW